MVKFLSVPALHTQKIFVEGSYYHVYNRGVNKGLIFNDTGDYDAFMSTVGAYLKEKPITDRKIERLTAPQKTLPQTLELIAYCLMPNHFHFLLRQKNRTAMTQFLRCLSTTYAMYFNAKYGRVGTLFQGRYKAIIVENEYYALHLSRYIHLNPIEIAPSGSDPVKWLQSYRFSSYPEYLGFQKTPWLKPSIVLSYFGGKSFIRPDRVNSYQSFVEDYVSDFQELGRLTLE